MNGNPDYILFAYIYPYTFKDSLFSIDEAERKCQLNETIFFDRQILSHSIEGRALTEMTISSKAAHES